ncbi:D-alanyl-D-alanine carboxypeptidase/D-alanyl-D-alanine-endopeptidase [Chitinivorax sp. PXF-14]|uniref:D-alanyl-D-alanine carboxypeptidase/D-alanyl-D-alanine endopeptidase n=1 Tax=Chitinivorax sp. PXF-14 TaxID=3230488 RepID=UPI003465ABE2
MPTPRRLLACVLPLVLAASATAASLPPEVGVLLKQAGVSPEHVAIYVKPADSRNPTLSWHGDRAMSPASVMKLLTTYAGLELLGPAFRWQTEFHATGDIANGVLDGNLVLRGGGDPKLSLERLWLMLRELRARGVREIRGDIVLDRLYWQPQAADPNAFDGHGYRTYNVGPDAFLANFQSVELRLRPAAGSVELMADPALPSMKLDNQLRLDGADCGDWKEKITVKVGDDGRVLLHGPLAASCGERHLYVSLYNPPRYFDEALRWMWQDMGGQWRGRLRDGQLADWPEARPLFVFDSLPLAEVVRDINKFSNNTQARMLFLALGGAYQPVDALLPQAAARIKGWLAGKHLDFPELVIENGSGLSRDERISAEHLGRLLESALTSPVGPELLSSLPVVAVDGTMKKRLSGSGVAAHIKTGSLDGVRSVAGVVHLPDGPVIVVGIINDARAAAAVPALDALIEWAGRPARP